jgi:hypothetical protein
MRPILGEGLRRMVQGSASLFLLRVPERRVFTLEKRQGIETWQLVVFVRGDFGRAGRIESIICTRVRI